MSGRSRVERSCAGSRQVRDDTPLGFLPCATLAYEQAEGVGQHASLDRAHACKVLGFARVVDALVDQRYCGGADTNLPAAEPHRVLALYERIGRPRPPAA